MGKQLPFDFLTKPISIPLMCTLSVYAVLLVTKKKKKCFFEYNILRILDDDLKLLQESAVLTGLRSERLEQVPELIEKANRDSVPVDLKLLYNELSDPDTKANRFLFDQVKLQRQYIG